MTSSSYHRLLLYDLNNSSVQEIGIADSSAQPGYGHVFQWHPKEPLFAVSTNSGLVIQEWKPN